MFTLHTTSVMQVEELIAVKVDRICVCSCRFKRVCRGISLFSHCEKQKCSIQGPSYHISCRASVRREEITLKQGRNSPRINSATNSIVFSLDLRKELCKSGDAEHTSARLAGRSEG